MKAQFPFEYVGELGFGPIYRPIAKVLFQSPQTHVWVKTWMVVDTGADFSILPRYIANDLGISLADDCKKDTISGIGGEQGIYLLKKKIAAKIGNLDCSVPLAFSDSNEIPALLGRLGFMETFDTEFLKTHTVVFKS